MVHNTQPSNLKNTYTKTNITNANNRVTIIKNNVRVTNIVNVQKTTIVNNYNPEVRQRYGIIGGYYQNPEYHNYYAHWYNHGFYGGFFYPVRPCYDIQNYLYYPMVSWLFVNNVDPYYYDQWYGQTVSVQPFAYAEDYYPSDSLRDLAIEVSALPVDSQGLFRTGMVNLTQALAQQLANNVGQEVTLGQNNIIVNHYENLQNMAVEVEGFVDIDSLNIHAAFKGLVDLVNPDQTTVFMPTGDTPSASDLATLDAINNRIQQLGGNPFVAEEEPDTTDGLDSYLGVDSSLQ